MKEAGDNQGRSTRRAPEPFKRTVFAVLLLLVALVGAPLAIEGLLAAAGFGESAAFFVESPSPGADGWVDNVAFTAPFFGRGLERMPASLYIPREKPDDELRVIVLGASAAMGDPMPEFGLARMLQAFMDLSVTNRRVRVINAAVTAINSHVVRTMVDDCLKVEPDAVVVYLGNNEVIGPYGPGTVFSGFYRSRPWLKAASRVRRSRTGQLLTLMQEAVAGSSRRQAWEGMAMFREKKLSADDPRVTVARSHFRENVSEAIARFQVKGVPVVLSTVAVNHDDFPPLLAPDGGETYKRATHLAASGDRAAAWTVFSAACDEDLLRFRADTGINDAIREVAGKFDARGVSLVDAAAVFRDLYIKGTPGSDLFVDHVHFTFEGNYELARLAAPAVCEALNLSGIPVDEVTQDACRTRLAFTPIAEQDFWSRMKKRHLRAPLSGRSGHRARILSLSRRVRDAQETRRATEDEAWIATLDRVLDRHPDDADVLMWRGRYRMQTGDTGAALADFQRAARIWPHRPTPVGHEHVVMTLEDGAQSAIDHLKSSWIGPSRRLPEVMMYVGRMLVSNGRYAQAITWFAACAFADPGHPGVWSQVGYARLMNGDADGAVSDFDRALNDNPVDASSLSYKGVALGELGRWQEAVVCLRQAADMAPDDPEVLYNYAVGLSREGDTTGAAAGFERVLELDPTDRDAADGLMSACWRQGDFAGAASACALAREQDPSDKMLAVRASLIDAATGNVRAARDGVHALMASKADDPASRYARAAAAWLDATAPEDVPNIGPMTDWVRRPESARSSALSLISPAALHRLGRHAEAAQQLQAAAVFADPQDEAIQQMIRAMREQLQKESRFEVEASARRGDPVIAALWEML